MTWSDYGLQGLAKKRKYKLPHDQPGRHEHQRTFLLRMERLEAIKKARKSATKEVRDGQEFTVVRLPDDVGAL